MMEEQHQPDPEQGMLFDLPGEVEQQRKVKIHRAKLRQLRSDFEKLRSLARRRDETLARSLETGHGIEHALALVRALFDRCVRIEEDLDDFERWLGADYRALQRKIRDEVECGDRHRSHLANDGLDLARRVERLARDVTGGGA